MEVMELTALIREEEKPLVEDEFSPQNTLLNTSHDMDLDYSAATIESSSDMVSEVEDDVDLSPIKFSKRRRRRAHPLPAILKRDIRRIYPTMLANTINSLDSDIISKFFIQFGTRSCSFWDLTEDLGIQLALPRLTSKGIDNVIGKLVEEVVSSADLVFQVNRAEIRRELYQSGSKLVLESDIRATKLNDFGGIRIVPCDNSFVQLEMKSTCTLLLDNNNRIYRILLRGQAEYR
eukprot:scaffold2785_cov165-Ochromonas_danica.AAC.16